MPTLFYKKYCNILNSNNLKNLLQILITLCIASSAISIQAQKKCRTDEIYQQHLSDPEIGPLLKHQDALFEREILKKSMQKSIPVDSVIVIPVVFHVLEWPGEYSPSDAQLIEDLASLNEDFQRLNADITGTMSPFDAILGNPQVEFRFAQLDPDGNCTTGIERHTDKKTDGSWENDGGEQYKIDIQNKWTNMWHPSRYLNFYLMAEGSYAHATQANFDAIYPNRSGVVGFAQFNTWGRALMTHEAGHWLGLRHTFHGGCDGTDLVDDTPSCTSTNGCPDNSNTCDEGAGDLNDNVNNFMSYNSCRIMFTEGQAALIHSVLENSNAGRNNLGTAANLVATGTADPYVYKGPNACDVLACNLTTYCNGTEDARATVHISSGAPPYSVMWSNGASAIVIETNGTNTQTGLVPGNYSVTVTDSNNDTTSCSTAISSTPDIALSSSILDATDCIIPCNGAIDLTAEGNGIGQPRVKFSTTSSGYSGNPNMADGDCTSDLFYIDFIPSLSYANIDETSIHSVCVSFTHPNPADLRINLVATVGGGYGWLELVAAGDIPAGENIDMACFTRDATNSISTGTAPFTGEWKPNDDFTTSGFILDNAVVNDYWYLSAWDCNGNGQTGSIDYFEVTFFDGVDNTTYAWSNSEATEDINALCPGSYMVTVTDNNGCIATHEAIVDCSVGIEDRLDENTKIHQVSPGILQIDTKNRIESIVVYGMNGKSVFQGKPSDNSIDLSKQSAGLYILIVNTAQGNIVRKVLLHD
jgi:hypothetical protein